MNEVETCNENSSLPEKGVLDASVHRGQKTPKTPRTVVLAKEQQDELVKFTDPLSFFMDEFCARMGYTPDRLSR